MFRLLSGRIRRLPPSSVRRKKWEVPLPDPRRLGVDTVNETGAIHLYEGVGMTVRRRVYLFEKHLTRVR